MNSPYANYYISQFFPGFKLLAICHFKMPRKKVCCFSLCQNTDHKTSNMFNFRPIDYGIWIEASNNESLKNVCLGSLFVNYKVCENHFHPTDFERILGPFKKRLRKHTIFPSPTSK